MEKYPVLNRLLLFILLIPSVLFADGEFGDIPSNTSIAPEETVCRNTADTGWESCATSGGGGGGSSAFDDITTGTNTTATMTVGTGGTLNASGGGVIAATTSAALAANGAN